MFTSCRACVLACSKMLNICLCRERETYLLQSITYLLVASAYSYVCVCMFVTWWVLIKRTLEYVRILGLT